MEKEVSFSQISAQLRKYSKQACRLDDDYVLAHLVCPNRIEKLNNPLRINGLSFFLCRKGSMMFEANLTPYTLSANMLIVVGHDSMINVKHISDQFEAYLMVVSPNFIKDINIDINVIQTMQFKPHAVPVISLSEHEAQLFEQYLMAIYSNTTYNNDAIFVRGISRCIMSAVTYQMMQFTRSRLAKDPESDTPKGRRTGYVAEFIKLVSKDFRTERQVSFYADRLHISPKYLSLLVKEATGRSAAEWINDYVILEAKNLLRFSGMNVQQIAYELNFSNQSSFGKYFKHLTGLSPTEFQRT